MMFGDWGTSRLYVLGLALFFCGHSSIYFMAAMSALLLALAWAYEVICRQYPDGGGAYSAAVEQSQSLAVLGGLLLCADYVVTAALSSVAAFHYLNVTQPTVWALAGIIGVGAMNFFGPRKAGSFALIAAIVTVAFTGIIGLSSIPFLAQATTTPPTGAISHWWVQFTALVLAISGVESIANMTGIMVLPVERTARRSIWPVALEIVCLNVLLVLAMQAVPLSVLGDGDIAGAYSAHRDDMLRLMANYYVGPTFAAVAGAIFAILLLSAVNTAISDLVSIQYRMAHDGELPRAFIRLNRWGMPAVALVLATAVSVVTVVGAPDVVILAQLYSLSVSAMIGLNLACVAFNGRLDLRPHERVGMGLLAVLLSFIALTVAYESPRAVVFVALIVIGGFAARWFAQHRKGMQRWMLAPIEFPMRNPLVSNEVRNSSDGLEHVPKNEPARRTRRVLVATEGDIGLLKFAAEQAQLTQAELIVVFVRHIAVDTPPVDQQDAQLDRDALRVQAAIDQIRGGVSIPIQYLYATGTDIGATVLDIAVREGVEMLILGSSRRSRIWKMLKGDLVQTVADRLPSSIRLIVQA
jgi:amino acid transporter/nucleotide-binding universal stress UspA family protein